MPSYNRVILAGHMTRDPELRYLPSNTPVVNFGLAMNRKWKNQSGEKQEEVTFVDCEAFGKTAELVNQYLAKGKSTLVEGRLKLDQWQNNDGQNRSKLKVVVEQVQFLGGGGHGQQSSQASAPTESSSSAAQPDEDDIPFSPDGFDGPAWM